MKRAKQEREEEKREMTRASRRWAAGFPGEGCPDLLFRFRAGIEGLQQRGQLPQSAANKTTTIFCTQYQATRCNVSALYHPRYLLPLALAAFLFTL
jgi:hypothetical protein